MAWHECLTNASRLAPGIQTCLSVLVSRNLGTQTYHDKGKIPITDELPYQQAQHKEPQPGSKIRLLLCQPAQVPVKARLEPTKRMGVNKAETSDQEWGDNGSHRAQD